MSQRHVNLSSRTHRLENLSLPLFDEESGGMVAGDDMTSSNPAYAKYVVVWVYIPGSSNSTNSYENLSGIIRLTDYSITRRMVSNHSSSSSSSARLEVGEAVGKPLTLDNPFDPIMMEAFGWSISGKSRDIINPYPSNSSLWFTIPNATKPQNDLRAFQNITLLNETSRIVWRSTMAQLMQHYCSLSH